MKRNIELSGEERRFGGSRAAQRIIIRLSQMTAPEESGLALKLNC